MHRIELDIEVEFWSFIRYSRGGRNLVLDEVDCREVVREFDGSSEDVAMEQRSATR